MLQPIKSKDKNPQNKGADKYDDPNIEKCVPEEIQNTTNQEIESPKGIENLEIFIDYINIGVL